MEVIIEIIKVIILGIVEGVTEWLPISSTGHMILVDEFISLNASPEFMKMFLVVIQLGAILAVILLYFNKLNPFSPKKSAEQKRDTWDIWVKVVIGCVPAGVLGVLLDDWFDAHFYNATVVALALIVYGIAFIVIETKYSKNREKITSFKQLDYRTALLIGAFQCLSLIPGTSRSGVTIIGALLLGASRFVATEYSFFMSIPIMFGASFLKLISFGFDFQGLELLYLLIGMSVAFIVSIVSIRFLLRYLKKNDFKVFGWYRIALGLVVMLYFWIR